jgi:hypothetical protein
MEIRARANAKELLKEVMDQTPRTVRTLNAL